MDVPIIVVVSKLVWEFQSKEMPSENKDARAEHLVDSRLLRAS